MNAVSVQLVLPHRLRRWVLPLGMVGVGALAAITLLLPVGKAAAVFEVGRIVFVLAYLGLMGVGMSTKRRGASVTVTAAGLVADGELLVPREAFGQVLATPRRGMATAGVTPGVTAIELRGGTPLTLEVASAAAAEELLASLDPGREAAAASFLATTTPTYVVVLVWMGIPCACAIPIQLLLMRGVGPSGLVALAVPCGVLWLIASWWVMRRRRVTVDRTAIVLPRVIGRDRVLSLESLVGITVKNTYEIRLAFMRGDRFTLKIYDGLLAADLVARLQQRAPRATLTARPA